jgi:uncharacterized membrane protein
MSWLFPWLLFLHVLGAILAFGPTFSFSIIGAMAGKEPQHANFATRATHAVGSRLVEPLAISMAVTGVGLILVTGRNLADRANWWLGIAIVIYAIALTFSLAVQNRDVKRIIDLTSAPPPPGASGPPPELPPIVKRVQRGGIFLGLAVIVIVFLMVTKPQF